MPAEAETPALAALRTAVDQRLPRVELTGLIVEVDAWTGFSQELAGLENEPRAPNHLKLLYAALLATGCNIPLSEMAQSAGLDYHALWRVATHYLREDTLKTANDRLVNYQHRQWLAAHWGGGTLSSSDGQRFPASGNVRNARAQSRYFGYGKGLTFYTHTSDQYAQYGSRAIAATVRDATYVLDEILGNETDLQIVEHVTDTAGYTDIVFALFDLLGLQFSPRLRDLASQRLCRIKSRNLDYPLLRFTAEFQPETVRRHWEDLLRVAASLKSGWTTASMLVSKLNAYPRQHKLARLLQQYGQLVKTNFILRYLESPDLRRRIHAQLNKGEQLHALRVWLWFGGGGMIRRRQEEQQQEQVRCLNLLTNLAVVWNTVYMQQALEPCRNGGLHPVILPQLGGIEAHPLDIAHLSPARYAHVNRLGRYSFENALPANGLRPLHIPAPAESDAP